MAVTLVAEILFGTGLKAYMSRNAMPGEYAGCDHMLRHYDEDILILGSSVAQLGIDARAVQDSLGMSCYNGGRQEQLFPYFLTTLKAAMAQHPPKHILLCMSEGNLSDETTGRAYDRLLFYYGMDIADIDSVLDSKGVAERVMNHSALYRLNRKWLTLVRFAMADDKTQQERNGSEFLPHPAAYPERWPYEDTDTLTAIRRSQLLEFMHICAEHGTELSVILTPRFFTKDSAPESPLVHEVRALCVAGGVQFHNDSRLEPFNSDSTLFFDCVHLNVDGAAIYTDTIIRRLL